MDRKLNVIFSFVLVLLFIFNIGDPAYYWRIIGGLFLSFLFSLAAFLLQRLSLDGMFAAIVIGTLTFGLGGWPMVAVVVLFFASSAVISGIQPDVNHTPGGADEVRRSGLQVWANGFWMSVCLVLAVAFEEPIFFLGGISAIAVATADTWATELRSTKSGSTQLITTFETVTPGTDGGVSLKGTLWSSMGSLVIAVASVYLFSLPFEILFFIFIAGFLGSLLDSYFGAAFQRMNRPVTIPLLHKKISIGNNLVNAASTGAGALLAIISGIAFI